MTPTPLPQLEIGDVSKQFDEATIWINGHEEETITIACEAAGDLADRLIRYVNAYDEIVKTLTSAAHALRSYEFGNSAPDLARDIAAHCDIVSRKMGAAA